MITAADDTPATPTETPTVDDELIEAVLDYVIAVGRDDDGE